MSGAVDFVTEKVFKPVREFVTKIWDNKLLRAIIIAAAIVYTVGVASGAWTWSLEAVSATGATYTTVGAEAASAASASNVTVGAIAPEAAIAAPTALPGAAAAAPATAAPVIAGGAPAAVAGETALVTPAMEAAATTASYSSVPEGAGLIEGAMNGLSATGGWMADNPMATMMIGSGLANADAAREARKQAEADQAAEDARIANVGVGGFNNMGAYGAPVNTAPQPGVVNSAAQPIQLAGNAAATRPISRPDLPQLQKQGLVAPA